MGAPNAPGLRLPDCPLCGSPVRGTLLDEGASYLPDPDQPFRQVTTLNRLPADAQGRQGEPGNDHLHMQPCGHVLTGDRAHQYLRWALDATWPHLMVEVRVVVPTALVPGALEPSILSTSALADVDEVRAGLGVHETTRQLLQSAARQAYQATTQVVGRTDG